MNLPDVNEAINQALEVAPELSATTGGIRDKEDGACAECIPSSPGKVSSVADQGKANPRIGSLCVGDEGVSGGCGQMRALHTEQGQDLTANGGRNQSARSCENTADSQMFPSVLDHFTNRIMRCVDKKLGRETELAEVGQ
jgi:hypothetical protein